MATVKRLCRQGRNKPLSELLRRVNPVLGGSTNYFWHGVSKAASGYLRHTWGGSSTGPVVIGIEQITQLRHSDGVEANRFPDRRSLLVAAGRRLGPLKHVQDGADLAQRG